MLLLLFASSFMTMPKKRCGTCYFANSSLRKHLTYAETWLLCFLGCQFWFTSPVLSSSSVRNRSSYKDSNTNTMKLSVASGWDHIPHTLVSWLLGRGIPGKRKICCLSPFLSIRRLLGERVSPHAPLFSSQMFVPWWIFFTALMISVLNTVERSLPPLWDFPTSRSPC